MPTQSENSRPDYIITFFKIALGCFMALGGFFGVLNDLRDAVTWQIALFCSLIVVVLGLVLNFKLREIILFQRARQFLPAIVFGSLIALWLAPILQFWAFVTTPLLFEPAKDDEILVIVLDFYLAENVGSPRESEKIINNIIEQIDDDLIDVKPEPTRLRSNDVKSARKLAKKYNASAIIWGDRDESEVKINFLDLNLHVNLREYYSKISTNVVIDPPDETYENRQYVIKDLPNQMAFLVFFAIGKQYVDVDNDKAIKYIKLATQQIDTVDTLPISYSVEDLSDLPEGLSEAYFLLGSIYHRRNDNNKAMKYYDRSIHWYENSDQVLSQSAYVYINRGLVKHELKQPLALSLEDFDKAIAIAPNAIAYRGRCLMNYESEDHENALEDCDRAIEIAPTYNSAYLLRGNVKYKLGQEYYDEVVADYNKAIETSPPHAVTAKAMAYHNLGNLKDKMGQDEEMIAPSAVIHSFVLDEVNTSAMNMTAVNNLNNKMELSEKAIAYYHEAIEHYDEAIILNPDYRDAYYHRGLTKLTLDMLPEAIIDLDRTIEIDPQHTEAKQNRDAIQEFLDSQKEDSESENGE